MARKVGSLYLLHFEPRYRHAGHYLGWSTDVPRRVIEHVSGAPKASPLVRAAIAAGCSVALVRVWDDSTRERERALKRQGGLSRQCPVCRRPERRPAPLG